MPIIYKLNSNRGSNLAIWKITESQEDLESKISPIEKIRIMEKVSSPVKRLQRIAARACLKEMLNLTHNVSVHNEKNGKPFLSEESGQILLNISLSHGKDLCGSIANSNFAVGLDVEWINPGRSLEIKKMFMNESEESILKLLEYDITYFYLIWCSKETLYKLYSKYIKEISFKRHLFTNTGSDQFSLIKKINAGNHVSFVAGISRHDIRSEVTIHSFRIGDYMITFSELDATNSNEIKLIFNNRKPDFS